MTGGARIICSLSIVALLWTSCAGPDPVVLPPEPEMPDFTQELEQYREYYKLRFLPDGYPGKVLEDSTLFDHPIYGHYVLEDYLKQYARQQDDSLLSAISMVADASVSRMVKRDSSLIFMYPKGDYITRAYKEHYSGLTQSYYMNTMWDVYEATGDSIYREAACGIFNSLLIPVAEGGVFHTWEGGQSIEEFPDSPNGFILNGWLSILWNVHLFQEKSGLPEAKEQFEQGVESMAGIIQLFDHEKLLTTRYSLSGPMVYRLCSDKKCFANDIKLSIPGEGEFKPEPKEKGSRNDWTNFLFKEDLDESEKGYDLSDGVRINCVLSRFSYPQKNEIQFRLTAKKAGKLTCEIFQGHYEAWSTQQLERKWKKDTVLSFEAGESSISIPLNWDRADLISFPTAFSKKINESKYNVYHYVHIDRLAQILEVQPNPQLQQYHDRWVNYITQWPNSGLYDGYDFGRVTRK
jgi:effector-binding domain-containing protein